MAEYRIGKVIRNLRKQSKLTQKELSKRTGLSQNTISNHENGIRSVGENEINIYSNALGVSREFLFKELDRINNSELNIKLTQFGDIVKKRRKELNIDLDKIYKKTKLSKNKMESIENGYGEEIGVNTLYNLVELLNISPRMIFNELGYFETYEEYIESERMRSDISTKFKEAYDSIPFNRKKELYDEMNKLLEKYNNKEE